MTVRTLAAVLLGALLLVGGFLVLLAVRGDEEGANLAPPVTSAPSGTGAATPAQKPKLKNPEEKSMSPSLIRKAQARLTDLGYYRGEIDGGWSRELGRAVKTFQRDRNIRISGILNAETRAALDI
ncbi:MAG: peptidoglycan-binding protein [Candidatus Krumholzibacteriia bacterium]